MKTECTSPDLVFQPLGARDVVGCCLLLGEAERVTGAVRQFAACFTDHRDPDAIEHTVTEPEVGG